MAKVHLPFCDPQEEPYVRRAAQIAMYASPAVEPNPYVGAVLVASGRILAEAFHAYYGGPHAEALVLQKCPNPPSDATLYITLEPCCHLHKKTPPCAPQIIQLGIRRVVVGLKDPNPEVAGKGIQMLQEAGIMVLRPRDVEPYAALIRHFYVNQREKRPYITLKWATDQGRAMGLEEKRLVLTDFWAQPYTHRLRARHAYIAVGKRTYIQDKPQLTVRAFWGKNPTPIIFTRKPLQNFLTIDLTQLSQAMQTLYEAHQVGSILVEGGRHILEIFLASGLYDEVHILQMPGHRVADVFAPFPPDLPYETVSLPGSSVCIYRWYKVWQDLEF